MRNIYKFDNHEVVGVYDNRVIYEEVTYFKHTTYNNLGCFLDSVMMSENGHQNCVCVR